MSLYFAESKFINAQSDVLHIISTVAFFINDSISFDLSVVILVFLLSDGGLKRCSR